MPKNKAFWIKVQGSNGQNFGGISGGLIDDRGNLSKEFLLHLKYTQVK
jgi:hypothetical protein